MGPIEQSGPAQVAYDAEQALTPAAVEALVEHRLGRVGQLGRHQLPRRPGPLGRRHHRRLDRWEVGGQPGAGLRRLPPPAVPDRAVPVGVAAGPVGLAVTQDDQRP